MSKKIEIDQKQAEISIDQGASNEALAGKQRPLAVTLDEAQQMQRTIKITYFKLGPEFFHKRRRSVKYFKKAYMKKIPSRHPHR